jgi:amino acid adenylation domain-containing protein
MSTSLKRKLSLSPRKRAVLASLLEDEGLAVPAVQGIPPREIGQPARLSFSQERIWFLEQLQPGSPVHNIPAAFRLPGFLNVAALEQSINEMVRRHEVLRTTFQSSGGQPVQVIAPELKGSLALMDLTAMPRSMREMEAYRLASEEALRPFDLVHGPLLRTTLVRLAPMNHLLLLSLHHIIADGWSMTVVWRELAAAYQRFDSGRGEALPALSIQYADFAEWQRNYLRGEVLENHLAYWRMQLAGAPPLLALPTDRPRPTLQRYAGAVQWWRVPEQLAQELKVLSEQEGATLFMTLLTVFKALLHRYTHRTDLIVGTPIANRTRTALEDLIGFFVNMLVLRTDFSGKPSFREALGRVREVTLAAYAHQDLPFEKLVEDQQPERDLGHNPLFQVMFVFQNVPTLSPKQNRAAPPQSSTPPAGMPVGNATAKFDLTLFALENERSLAGAIEYNTDLFEATTIQRLVDHFQNLLAAAVADPDRPLSELNFLSETERRQILFEWNATDAGYPRDACLQDLFAMQAAKTPPAVALAAGDQQVTYAELQERSNYLASLLRRAGVSRDTPVAVLAKRSVETVIAQLAIFKAGGCYVPIESTQPKERLDAILADCKARVLLTQGEALEAGEIQSINLNEVDWTSSEEDSPLTAASAESVACVLYISGPSGTPVGVCVSHRALARMAFDPTVDLRPGDRLAQLTDHSTSAALFEIWSALLHGAQLTLIDADPSLSPRLFATEIDKKKITVMLLRAALFHHVISEVPNALYSVRDLFVTGEAADAATFRQFQKQRRPARLFNVYGLTECSALTACELVTNVPDWANTIPIGRATSNTHIHLLDEMLQPVPIGVTGELYVGGDAAGSGYLNQPDLTAARFISDPFGQPGARLCKTGDLGRYLPDGRLELAGRTDRCTKIKGVRVEPQEIEQTLAQHEKVRDAAVLTRENLAGDKRLTAYLAAADPNNEPTPSELRRFVRSKLPEYMLPSDFILLSSLPRTATGQLDVAALPSPETERPPLEQTFVAPTTVVEKELVHIWSQVFGLAKIGIRDNFFHLGGHSLLATQVISRARDSFQVELPVRRLFESPNIEGLAKFIETSREGQTDAVLRAIRTPRADILNRLDELSEAEVDSLLHEMLQENAPVVETAEKIKPRAEDELLSRLDELTVAEVDSLLGQLLTEETSK